MMRRPGSSVFGRALLLTALVGCGTKETPAPPSGPSEAEVAQKKLACEYKAGMLAKETLPAGYPTGKDLPIEHIVLIMQENRSFDHYFSELNIPGLEVASRDITNPDSHGNPVQRFHFNTKCMYGGDHGWDAEHKNYNGGKLDGFVTSNGDSHTPMGYYDEGELPYYYALARTFAISDHHFSSVLAPTWPNRMFFFAGTSWGLTHNVSPPAYDAEGNKTQTLFSSMSNAHVSWRVYSQDYPTPSIVPGTIDEHLENFYATDTFATDVAKGDLAQVTLVEASDLKGVDSPDEGPPGDVDLGQQFVGGVISTIMHSPFWKNTVIFITYDENGGMYDHVPPPTLCKPDNYAPDNGSSDGFDRLGFRVPFFVVSPFAKRGYVSHTVTDHTAILRFVEARFDLPALTARDANATAPYEMFDFQHPDFSIPSLPETVVDQAELDRCHGH